jgi:hypothetical protein
MAPSDACQNSTLVDHCHQFCLCAHARGVERSQCYAFACPPCVDRRLAADCKDYIFSVALRDDVVMRFSPQALAQLHEKLRTYDVEPAMQVCDALHIGFPSVLPALTI